MGAEEPELWIVIRNWERFQHYADRDPPWIKNYTRLMSDDNYMSLTPHQCALLHRLWLEYARSGCQLRANTASLTRQLGLRVSSRQLEALNHAGFLEFSLAPRATRARALARDRDRDREKKELTTSSETYAVARAHARNADGENLINDGEAEPEMPDAPWPTPAELPADLWRMP